MDAHVSNSAEAFRAGVARFPPRDETLFRAGVARFPPRDETLFRAGAARFRRL